MARMGLFPSALLHRATLAPAMSISDETDPIHPTPNPM
jgi:hypothetical protein